MTIATLSACREVAPEIYQVRLPLPFALNHVNCYLLRDPDGWTVVDAGLNRPEIRAQWQAVFSELGIASGQVRRIVLTHMHPDHFGAAGWLQQETGAPVYISPREWEVAEVAWVQNYENVDLAAYLRSVGAPQEIGATILEQQNHLRRMTLPHPVEVHLLPPGSLLTMGGRRFQAIHAPGHADGQLIFYSAEDRLMLCGDQVLLRITPNVGVWPTSQTNPLRRYLDSLDELRQFDVRLALPGHHGVVENWRTRVTEIAAHHEERLAAMFEAALSGATALQVAFVVFNFDQFSPHEMRFAVAETLAHLEYLAEEGRLVRVEQPARRVYRGA